MKTTNEKGRFALTLAVFAAGLVLIPALYTQITYTATDMFDTAATECFGASSVSCA